MSCRVGRGLTTSSMEEEEEEEEGLLVVVAIILVTERDARRTKGWVGRGCVVVEEEGMLGRRKACAVVEQEEEAAAAAKARTAAALVHPRTLRARCRRCLMRLVEVVVLVLLSMQAAAAGAAGGRGIVGSDAAAPLPSFVCWGRMKGGTRKGRIRTRTCVRAHEGRRETVVLCPPRLPPGGACVVGMCGWVGCVVFASITRPVG